MQNSRDPAKSDPLLDMAALCLANREPAMIVTVDTALGSSPREAGAAMLVSRDEMAGTIGGGQLEFIAIAQARTRLARHEAGDAFEPAMDIPLGPEIGQCCGGRVVLAFSLLTRNAMSLLEAARQTMPHWPMLIFGAGHTGTALARQLSHLPMSVSVIDTRREVLQGLPANVGYRHLAMPEEAVREAEPGSAYVILTHEHHLDFLIAAEVLGRADAAYAGMIGSKTKRAVFTGWLEDQGHRRQLADSLLCPIGGSDVRDKRPEIIAALTAAELVRAFTARDQATGSILPPQS